MGGYTENENNNGALSVYRSLCNKLLILYLIDK